MGMISSSSCAVRVSPHPHHQILPPMWKGQAINKNPHGVSAPIDMAPARPLTAERVVKYLLWTSACLPVFAGAVLFSRRR